MNVHASHLKDDDLFECYFAIRSGEPVDPRVAVHLGDCSSCGTRYDEFVELMDGVREDAEAETAARFTDERLERQRQQILQRLLHVQRSARVITFPGRELAGTHAHATVRVAPRWLAAAAAACLCVGAGLGAYVGPRRAPAASVPAQAVVAAQRPAPIASPAVLVSNATTDADDEAFLMELELALAAPHLRELQPFDALTPHVRDIDTGEQ